MSLIAIVGNATTTTTLALAEGWPSAAQVLVAELDPSGGDLAAWLDLPQSPGLASAVTATPAGAWPTITGHVQQTPSGVAVLVAPLRAVEATAAVREAAARLLPTLSALDTPTVLADCGSQVPSQMSSVVTQAGLVVVTVRQPRTSDRAAAAVLDRTAELIDHLVARHLDTVAVVVGDAPYAADEIEAFLGGAERLVPTLALPDDPAGAAALAGRPMSRRLALRSPLRRAAAGVAAELAVRERASRRSAPPIEALQ